MSFKLLPTPPKAHKKAPHKKAAPKHHKPAPKVKAPAPNPKPHN
jgi:hypothetical protein